MQQVDKTFQYNSMPAVLPHTPTAAGAPKRAPRDAPLARSAAEPLYRQLAEQLQRRIASGELAAGAQLESETALMARYGVSRVTVRQATALLREHGKVVARRGKGTFVIERVLRHDLDALQGFYDAVRSQGVEPQMQLLEFSADAGALDRQAPAGADLPVRLQRLYAVDGRPFALVVGYLPKAAAALGRERAEHLTVYQIVEQYLNLQIAHAEVTIRCERPPRAASRHLGLKPGEPALVMERRSYAQGHLPCEFMRITIVPERYEFRLRVPGTLQIAGALHRISRRPSLQSQKE